MRELFLTSFIGLLYMAGEVEKMENLIDCIYTKVGGHYESLDEMVSVIDDESLNEEERRNILLTMSAIIDNSLKEELGEEQYMLELMNANVETNQCV